VRRPNLSGVQDARQFVGLTWWSLVSLVLAVPIWIVVVRSAVMSRVVDGGIFLSVSAGVADGLTLYEQIWDNKDPLFFGVMALATIVNPAFVFFLDVMWIALAGLGAGLIARMLMSADRALFVGLVVTPLLMLGPAYVPGWTNTPGTALVLLSLGLLASRWAIAAGIAAGVLAFVKLPVWPIAAAGLIVVLVAPSWRRNGARALVAMGVTMLASVGAMAILGWLSGAIEALQRNRQYALDVANYFGFDPGLLGRWSKAVGEWPGAVWWSALIAIAVVIIAAVVWTVIPSLRSTERSIVLVWAALAWLGTAAMLGLTYVWPHHVQALALPTVLSGIVFAALFPPRWPFAFWVLWVCIGAYLVSGWGSLQTWQQKWQERSAAFDIKVQEIGETPIDARLLDSVPLRDFTYARLGSNDDRGFLGSVRDDAVLSCPQFHLYDFSPPEAFSEALECVQQVDAVIVTDAFTVFGSSARAPFATPVLDYVQANFTCLRIDDRQVCTRNPR